MWIVENTYECGMLECYICDDETASFICTSFMNDEGGNCWIYESSHRYYCESIVFKMGSIIILLWIQLILGV